MFRTGSIALLACLLGTALSLAGPALQWREVPVGRAAALTMSAAGRTGFAEVPAEESGITFTNVLPEARYLTNQILLNGSGVAAGDVDGDGWCDLYFCSLEGPNGLYRNLGGWKFTNVTEAAGVACGGGMSTGAALVDVDGDGDIDLLVNGLGLGTRLFLNDGAGRFREATAGSGLRSGTGAHSLALADVDGDGDLDLYVVNYRPTTFRDEPSKRYRVATANNRYELLAVDGRPVTEPDLAGRFTVDRVHGVMENGEADRFYLNDGRGRFTASVGPDGTFQDEEGRPVALAYDWGLSALFHDLNGDGAPDLYVCNDFQSPDRIWLNDGRGHFRAAPRLAIRQTSIFSMGVDVADVDRDGRFDLFVADMLSREHARRQVQLMERQPSLVPPADLESRPQYSRNTLLWNRGDGTFAEIAQLAGVEASDWTWCPVFLDVDLDGYEDLLTVTGHVRDAQNIDIARQIDALIRERNPPWREQLLLRHLFQPLHTPNFAFRNRGDLTFVETGQAWGFASKRVSQGVALADLDNDGDLDVVVNCLNDGALLCRNESSHPRVAVRLRGTGLNTQGIGACITVRQPGMPDQSQEIIAGGRYLSSDDSLRVFAAAGASSSLQIEVAWRSGARTVLTNASANHLYELAESAGAPASAVTAAPPLPAPPLFEDLSGLLGHSHQDEPYDDFARQPLLPHKLSHSGPAVAWFDADGDGWEDLLVAGGRGGRLATFINNQKGGFTRSNEPARTLAQSHEETAVLGWRPEAGNRRLLLVAAANYDTGETNEPAVVEVDLASGTARALVPGQAASTGALALGDIDGDGDLDLFVGGRVVAGRYPEPADSLILLNNAGRFLPDPVNCPVLAGVGMVSGVALTDLNGSGVPELVLACDCGPLRVFANSEGRLKEWIPNVLTASGPPRTLAELTGWWNTVASGDFDGDGRLDLIAGNWGRNTRYQSFLDRPVHLYSGDLNGDGIVEVIEGYEPGARGWIVPWRDWATLGAALPFLHERYHSFTEFSQVSVAEFLDGRLGAMRHSQITTLDSVVLLNRGGHFELHPLPLEAQLAPVFGIAVADFNGDGREDAFVAQNFFAVTALTSRLDGGVGVLLLGDGRGGFRAVPARESGLRVYGEGRGAAACDFDHDGRVDLAVGQHSAATRLFRNAGAEAGLRVRLQGPPGNPMAIGAKLRTVLATGGEGPVREIRSGSACGSSDATTQVFSRRGVRALEVAWPDGRQTRAGVADGATEIVLAPDLQ